MTTTETKSTLNFLKNTYNETTDGPNDAAILKAIAWAESSDSPMDPLCVALTDLAECWDYWDDSCSDVAADEIATCEEQVCDIAERYGL